ncbi:S8 family peptidase [Paenibacillus senegalensis]|uniref:S8 family peptidase n=1 Tax=Paenibacillus senegalensis TaxID=1465766 RepID=UPI0002888BD9|nr:S8 family peptidase [Paenibacillus senegalensis]
MEKDLIRSIHDELQNEEASPRFIIQFKSAADYSQFLDHVTELIPSLENLSYLQPLPAIHGFTCKLRNQDRLRDFAGKITVEEDKKVALVHARPPKLSSHSSNKISVGDQLIPWGVRQIKAPAAWSRSAGLRVKIAVIDTGIDYLHPDLHRNVAGGINVVDRRALPRDDNGHGTHIAGTIAAYSSKKGIIGVAPLASLYAVKAFDHNGTAYISDIVHGIDWCVRNRIDIINMSFGMKTHSKALEDAVRRAHDAGVIIVASSGNDGRSGRIDYPARFPQTIAVGATNKNKKVAKFSNRGKRIDIYGPGEKIYSSWLNGKYNELSGTSMATSHVSGVIALLFAQRGRMSARLVKDFLKASASPITTIRKTTLSTGEVHALQTLKAGRS